MGNITLGSVTLSEVTGYNQTVKTSIPKKKIVGKSTPTYDVDGYTVEPEDWTITAYCTSAQKETLKGYKASTRSLTDDEGTRDMWIEQVIAEFSAKMQKWVVKIIMMKK